MIRLHRRRSRRLHILIVVVFALALYRFYYVRWRAPAAAQVQLQAANAKKAVEAQELLRADIRLDDSASYPPAGQMTAHQTPDFDNIEVLQDLDPSFVPSANLTTQLSRRLIVIGDVHGQKASLVALLQKLVYNNDTDHLVFVGDLIAKGPDSVGVVQLAIELGASAVRGNHEDRLLLSWTGMRASRAHLDPRSKDDPALDPAELDAKLSNTPSFSRSGEFRYRVLSREFNEFQLRWLGSLPLILRVGNVTGMGEVLVVHGGLVPGLELKKQDPYGVMNMLTVDLHTHVASDRRQGTPWIKLWNRYQEKQASDERSTVIYGHDSREGLVLEEYTKGIDSNCVRGGQLTAFVIEGSEDEVKQSIVQVDCEKSWS